MRLLIAIPVFNERQYVERVIDKVRTFHDQILLVDDGSTDGTTDHLVNLVEADGGKHLHLVRHPENRGYGQSLIDAFAWAARHKFDWVITMDCDEQHEPEMIPEFVRAIERDDADVISGSRYLQQRADDDLPPGDRRLINVTVTSLLNALFDLKLTDSFCGFKAHRVAAMQKLKLDVPGYAFPLQFWPQVARAQMRVTEIPVRLIYNDPNRYFGGLLDDSRRRLAHYVGVLNAELERPEDEPVALRAAAASSSRAVENAARGKLLSARVVSDELRDASVAERHVVAEEARAASSCPADEVDCPCER